jgi:hypothetical protein
MQMDQHEPEFYQPFQVPGMVPPFSPRLGIRVFQNLTVLCLDPHPLYSLLSLLVLRVFLG